MTPAAIGVLQLAAGTLAVAPVHHTRGTPDGLTLSTTWVVCAASGGHALTHIADRFVG